jgi:hypothetical protein
VTNFTIEDLTNAIIALPMFALLMVPPAWLLCLAANPFSFNRCNILRKAQLIVIVSISALPSLDFLIGKFLGFQSAALFNLICTAVLLVVLALEKKKKKAIVQPANQTKANSAKANLHKATAVAFGFALVWLLISFLSLVDWQTAPGKIFPSITVQDYVKDSAITDAIRRTGVPPVQPMFLTPNKDKLFYYYFWFMLCALGPALTHGAITARAAVMAGTAWVGFGIFSLSAFFSAQLSPTRTNRWRVAIIASILVFVTGLDLIPVGLGDLISLSHHQLPLFPTIDWWNVYLTNCSGSAIFIPQHVAGLIVGFFSTFLLRDIQKFSRRAWRNIPLAALCIASAPGVSIYVTLVFVVVWAIWIALSFRESSGQSAKNIIITALGAIFLAAPYVLEMIKANHSHKQQLALYVRPITFLSVLIHPSMPDSAVGHLIESAINLSVLPFNYFLELGFFFIASYLFWRGRKPKDGDEKLLLVVFWVSLAAGSFIRSTVFNNDFGWRSTLPAQFAVLLWSAFYVNKVFSQRQTVGKPLMPITKLVLISSFVIGLGGSIYDLVMLRIAHIIGMRECVGVNDGARNYALRQIYEKISLSLPESAVIQHNPEVVIDAYSGNYSNRQFAFADYAYGTLMGTDEDAYNSGSKEVGKIFTNASMEEMNLIRKKYGITALVVKRSDPIWSDKEGWQTKLKPYFENSAGAIYRFDL